MSHAESRPSSYGSTRGRPRSKAVEQAILEAVLRLLEDGVPLADLSVETIARTAGVGKAAIYRRWSDKEDLFVDVIRAAEPAERELPVRRCGTTWSFCWSQCANAAWPVARRRSCTPHTPR